MNWRRTASILGLVLLGAGATGIGMGTVLFHARTERNELQAALAQRDAELTRLNTEHTRLIADAQSKVSVAEEQAKQTQEKLDSTARAQAELIAARTLPSPDPRQSRSWKTVLSIPLGVSVRIPVTAKASFDDQSLTATVSSRADTAGEPWFSLTRYSAQDESVLRSRLQTASTTVSYRVQDRLVLVEKGTSLENGSRTLLVRVQENGTPQFLIWMRVVPTITEPRLLEILSTLTFAS